MPNPLHRGAALRLSGNFGDLVIFFVLSGLDSDWFVDFRADEKNKKLDGEVKTLTTQLTHEESEISKKKQEQAKEAERLQTLQTNVENVRTSDPQSCSNGSRHKPRIPLCWLLSKKNKRNWKKNKQQLLNKQLNWKFNEINFKLKEQIVPETSQRKTKVCVNPPTRTRTFQPAGERLLCVSASKTCFLIEIVANEEENDRLTKWKATLEAEELKLKQEKRFIIELEKEVQKFVAEEEAYNKAVDAIDDEEEKIAEGRKQLQEFLVAEKAKLEQAKKDLEERKARVGVAQTELKAEKAEQMVPPSIFLLLIFV